MSSPPPPDNPDGRHLDKPIDATRDSTGADISPEIELRHGTEHSAAEFPIDPEMQPGAHQNAATPREPARAAGRPRRRTCVTCLIIFIILAAIAAIGNWLMQRSGSPTVSIPGIPNLPSVEIPTFNYPDLTHVPPNQPGVQPPSIFSPQPTPHTLPNDTDGVVRTLEPVVRARFGETVKSLGLTWPPERIRLVGLKMEKVVELWAADKDGPFQLVKTYPIFAASGDIGPKRRQGDKQVPEGHYRLVYLNPQSKYHLSLLLDYPNKLDKAREAGAVDNGADLGGDICVHGSAASIGCIAIGDAAIEEVFTLVALADSAHRDIVILPADLRKRPDLVTLAGEDESVLELYSTLSELAKTVTPDKETVTAIGK